MQKVKDLFLKYVKFDTKSDFNSQTQPTTKSQLAFAKILAEDCSVIGLSEVEVWEAGYVTATLPSNTDKNLPVVSFVAHMDTSPDFSGSDVKPCVIESYDGKDIILKSGLCLSPSEFPVLKEYINQELITTDGSTLLGADDKAGVAEILAAMDYLIKNPNIKHGKIRIAFTPDEEVGRGVDKFDVNRFGADFGYTVDGGRIGELEMESFNAARAMIEITGKSVHPGSAKGIMINALLVAQEISSKFPENETPATTEGLEGFYHLTRLTGQVESAKMQYIIRDFDKISFNRRKDFIIDVVRDINKKYGKDLVSLNLFDEYFNMREVLENKLHIVELAKKAMEELNITPIMVPIRGGTDGSRLSFMGLPCPNIFTGGHNYHGPYEFIPVPSMEKAVSVIVRICENVAT